MRKPNLKTIQILRYILRNEFEDLALIGRKFGYISKEDYIVRHKIKQLLENNKELITIVDNKYYPTEKGKELIFKEEKFILNKSDQIEIHNLSFECDLVNKDKIEDCIDLFENKAQLMKYSPTRSGFNGSMLNIYVKDLMITFVITTKGRAFINFNIETRGNNIKEMMLNKMNEIQNIIIPNLERKFTLKFEKGLFGFTLKLHKRHIALINNDLDKFCRQLGLKISVKDITKNEYIIVLDNSKGYNHIEGEVKENNEQIANGIINVCMEAKDGFTFKKTHSIIDTLIKEKEELKQEVEEEKNVLKIISDNLLKQQELMAYHLNVIRDLKKEIEILKQK